MKLCRIGQSDLSQEQKTVEWMTLLTWLCKKANRGSPGVGGEGGCKRAKITSRGNTKYILNFVVTIQYHCINLSNSSNWEFYFLATWQCRCKEIVAHIGWWFLRGRSVEILFACSVISNIRFYNRKPQSIWLSIKIRNELLISTLLGKIKYYLINGFFILLPEYIKIII